jgi:hypothetical protein
MSNTNTNLTVFLDNIGRTIIGKVSNETDEILSVENPALVHIQANPQTSQLQLQILPLFFKEFQEVKSDPTVWNYKKSTITLSEKIVFAAQFSAQYEQLFQSLQGSPREEPAKVVKLFDE